MIRARWRLTWHDRLVVLRSTAQTYDLQKRYAVQEQLHTEVHYQADLQVRSPTEGASPASRTSAHCP